MHVAPPLPGRLEQHEFQLALGTQQKLLGESCLENTSLSLCGKTSTQTSVDHDMIMLICGDEPDLILLTEV